ASVDEGGASTTYTFTITNNSVVTDPVTVTSISDTVLGNLLGAAETANGGPIVLASGGSFTFTYTTTLTQNVGDSVTNVVTVHAKDDENTDTSASDDHTVTFGNLAPSPTLRTSDLASVDEGGASTTYTFTITNN